MKSLKFARVVFIALVLLGIVMFWLLATSRELKLPGPTTDRIVAKQDLRAFTLLRNAHLEGRAVNGQNALKLEALADRYLLVDVKKGGEVKDEMLAARDATPVLADAMLVSIPASATTLFGGQLRAGELIDLVVPPSLGNPVAKKFEGLVVLSSTQQTKDLSPPTTILLAVPSSKRDEFAAVAGAQLLVSRKIVVHN